jgi:hypothetical protein
MPTFLDIPLNKEHSNYTTAEQKGMVLPRSSSTHQKLPLINIRTI